MPTGPGGEWWNDVVQEAPLTQLANQPSDQVNAYFESEAFRTGTATQILEQLRTRTRDGGSAFPTGRGGVAPPGHNGRDAPSMKRTAIDFFPQRSDRDPKRRRQQHTSSPTSFLDDSVVEELGKPRHIPGPAGEIRVVSAAAARGNESRGDRRRMEMNPLLRRVQGKTKAPVDQGEDPTFRRSAWVQMLAQQGLPPFQDASTNLLDYSVKYVQLFGYHKRVPLLFVVIRDINSTDIETVITVKDPTGDMEGIVHRLVLEKYGSELCVGAVLQLKMVTVFNPTQFTHFLNITDDTVERIISPDVSPPHMEERTEARLRTMQAGCIYKRRRDLETPDLRKLHMLAQKQLRMTLQRREAMPTRVPVSFH
eukprot:CAMPEP_0119158932 /NCGR_PEP_ID=MMETSP1310-20130426/53511_1 /TAXON_ID=464262 /ORGANISM="Genus nov. species nov., Strain RCC2339" /LENGTH=365 /DNA_ID=CAMNT_0007151561 /DNA_START=333 /DNA_END=1427 /DNA_ORIENTATION=+